MKKVYEAPAVLLQNVCTASLMTTSISVNSTKEVESIDDLLGKERDNGNDGAWTDGLW